MTDRYSDDADATDYYGGEEPPTPEDPNRTGDVDEEPFEPRLPEEDDHPYHRF